MKVTTGAERSESSRTLRPFESRRYSSIPPADLTKLKPSTDAGAADSARVETSRASNAKNRFIISIGEKGDQPTAPRAGCNKTNSGFRSTKVLFEFPFSRPSRCPGDGPSALQPGEDMIVLGFLR